MFVSLHTIKWEFYSGEVEVENMMRWQEESQIRRRGN